MSFERFIDSPRQRLPKLTVGKDGRLRANKPATEKYNLMDYKHVVLYYDPENRRIGLEFTNDGSELGARAVWGRAGVAEVWAGGFLKRYGITPSKTRQYVLVYDQETNMLIIDLKTEKGLR